MYKNVFFTYNILSLYLYIIIEQNIQNNKAFDFFNLLIIQNNVAIMYYFVAIYCNIIVQFKKIAVLITLICQSFINFLPDVRFLCI